MKSIRKHDATKAASALKQRKAKATTLQEKLDITELEEAVPKRKYSGRKRGLEEVVDKALRDNFKTWSLEQVNLFLVDGKSLRDTILADKKAKAEEGKEIIFGKAYYESLRMKYRQVNEAEKALVVQDHSMVMDVVLSRALKALLSSRRVTDLMEDWADTVEEVNQKNLTALYRGLLKTQPHANLGVAAAVERVMAMLVRLDLHQKFPDMIVCMKPLFDSALLKTLSSYKQNQQSSLQWFNQVSDYIHLVLPKAATEKCIKCESDWGSVADDLRAAVASSDTGARLFQNAYKSVEAKEVSSLIAASTLRLHKKSITSESVKQEKKKFVDQIRALGKDPFEVFKATPKEFTYRGVKIFVKVVSIIDEWSVAMETYVRGVGVGSDKLPALWCENDLVPAGQPKPTGAVSAELLHYAKGSRAAATTFMSGMEATSSNIMAIFTRKRSFLTKVDKMWRIEEAFFTSFIGTAAGERLQIAILVCMKTEPRDLKVAASKIEELGESKLMRFVGSGLQETLVAVGNILKAMIAGRCPRFSSISETEFISEVKDVLASYYKKPDCVTVVEPAAAIAQHYKHFKEKFDSSGEVQYKDVSQLVTFNWLLGEADRAGAIRLANSVAAKSGGSAIVKAAPVLAADVAKRCRQKTSDGGSSSSSSRNIDKLIIDDLFK